MISRPLIDLLNSGEAVALVGSGISTEAKLPSWWSLFDQIATDLHSKALDTRKAREHATKNRLPEAFDMLSNLTSREDIYSRVIALIEKVKTVGKYHTMLADWPFKLYITTNFDHLLEDASKGRLTSIGNRGKELPKMSGGVSNVVWHIHGGTKLSRDISQLVVSKADYDDFYPTSNVVSSLKSITSTHQCIIVGFGFNDRDLLSVMHAVGRLGNSGRPSFAFLAYDETTKDIKSQQDELRRKYNVEVIPYFKREQRHDELYRLMCGYQSFVVRRSISLGRLPKATPTYDSLASSLKIQNNLDIGELSANHAGLRSTLIGARVLAHIREHPAGDCDLASVYRSNDPTEAEVFQCLATLRAKGLVTPPPPLSLTPAYQAKADAAQGRLEVTKTLFLSSLQNRASDNTNLDEPAQKRVVAVVSHFLDELCRERGLGVAQNLATSDAEQASRRTVSLIQRLPDHFAQCASHEEALMAVNLTADILTKSSEAESTFLGLLCQAYFGQHLVKASDKLSKVDLDLINGTCYLLDASVLVCLLAEGSEVHHFTLNLINDLKRSGAVLATTDMFVSEVYGHASWPLELVDRYGENSEQVLAALRCLGSYRSNQFLRGYFLYPNKDASFQAYVMRTLGMKRGERISDALIAEHLSSIGIQALNFDQWEGFDETLFARRDEVQQEVSIRREERGTYKNPWQTKAEAEVALVVDGIRRKQLQPKGVEAKDAFFLSSTRVVDKLPNLERRISLRPEGLAQWLWSSQATSPKHGELVFEQLLWELAQGGIEFVDSKTLLRRFSGVIEAANADLAVTLKDRRDLLVHQYGADPSKAFADADPLDIPRLNTEAQKEALDRMDRALKLLEKQNEETRAAAKISEKDRAELAAYRERKKVNKQKAKSEKRAAQSRVGKKKKKK